MNRVLSSHIERRRRRRGFTLLEMMVGVFIALFLTAAAVVFASHETKLLGYSTEQVDAQQQARAAVDLLTSDLQMAGAGIGYSAGNTIFAGLQTGAFTTPGGLAFGPTTLTLRPGDLTTGASQGATYTLLTRDLGILVADGPYATVAQHTGLAGEYCDPTSILGTATQRVVLRTEDGLSWQTIRLTPSGVAGACTWGQCVGGGAFNGCRAFTLTAEAVADRITSDAAAPNLSYTGGEIHSGFKQVVWFVDAATAGGVPTGAANLRRAIFDADNGACANRAACGSEQAYNVETLQYQVWRFSPQANAWLPVNMGPIAAAQVGTVPDRLRIDLELVVRSRSSDGKAHDGIQLRLANPAACVPNTACPPTPASRDNIPRRAYRWTVQIRNSGRMM